MPARKTKLRKKPAPSPLATPGRSCLVVVSVDGLRPDFYRRPDELGVRVPALEELVESGASADAVESIFPSTTYPAHATIVTGVPPRIHGIYSHLATRDPTQRARPWHWFARALRVPALWDAARAAGLRTASVGWPVSAGAAVDHNVPEIWDPTAANPFEDFRPAAENSTPGLFDELQQVLRPQSSEVTHDHIRVEAALYLWERYRPDLLLIHLVDYDSAAHHFGPLSREALAAVERSDTELARIRAATLDRGGTTLVVLSDHGFVPVEKDVSPLAALAQAGLFERTGNGHLSLKRLGAIHAGGSFAVYWLEPPAAADQRALELAIERVVETGSVASVVRRPRLKRLGADPDAELIFDAAPGFFYSDRSEGPIVRESTEDHGTHGHLPSRPGLEASFIAVGAGIRPGKNLGRFPLTRVAATLSGMTGLPPGALATKEKAVELG